MSDNTTPAGPLSRLNQKLIGFRTTILAALVGIPSIVVALADQITAAGVDLKEPLSHFFTPQVVGLIGTHVSILIIVCRVFTSTTIFKKE